MTLCRGPFGARPALAMAWRWSEAEPEFRRAIELNPNNADPPITFMLSPPYLGPENHLDEAQDQYRTALSLDPLSSIVNMNYAITLAIAHRYPESLTQLNKVIESNPKFRGAHLYLSEIYANMGRFAEAVSELQKFRPIPGSFSADAHGYDQLMHAIAPELGYGSPLALTAALLGDRDKTFEHLEQGFAVEDGDLTFSIRYPAYDPYRSDPRYADLMRRLGLPQ